MANFSYLKFKSEYKMFADAAIEAERVYHTSPAMSAVGSRKALELAVKWVYAADSTMEMPYKDNLMSLIHEPSFRFELDSNTWEKLRYIVRLGNSAVHSDAKITSGEALTSLKGLFEFLQWIEYCYDSDYLQKEFDPAIVPTKIVKIDNTKVREQQSLIEQKDAEIEALQKKIAEMSDQFVAQKEQDKSDRVFIAEDISEYETRKRYIDVDLKLLGWVFEGNSANVQIEYPIYDMQGDPEQKGFIDYVLFGKDGKPLAIIEAKRTSKDPNVGKQQAKLYADSLERQFGRRPMIFNSNGFSTYFWDDVTGPQRSVGGFFSQSNLQKLMNRRTDRKPLNTIEIDDAITDRYYQKEAIRAVCDNVEAGFRKNLLVMATGTGKTRTASSLTDVLSRGGYVKNVLFLADRIALVKQAKDDFKNYLKDMSLCNLCSNKDDVNARIVFSTYPTILNAIDNVKNDEGRPLFTPAHFDLIIIDESHRSIFKKYKMIFDYFDAILVGLTATPRDGVDKNTYDFFEVENKVPTYAYDYETAVYKDHVLVPYYNYLVRTKFLSEGIKYDDLPEEEKAQYEDIFDEDNMPDVIPPEKLNKFIFNQNTVDMVIQDLMERGMKTESGDTIGKSIVFAQNKAHADYIVERFDKLYPMYKGKLARKIVCSDSYAQSLIDEFKKKNSEIRIAVSVDMMDTGIDVPECVNLVFFKKVYSKTKFWQMIGRGTRLAANLYCMDQVEGDYTGKKRFLIFDYLGNFDFFGENPNGFEAKGTKTLSENIFSKQVELICAFQEKNFATHEYQAWRSDLVDTCHEKVASLVDEKFAVKLQREHVEKYRDKKAFISIDALGKKSLIDNIAPLVVYEDKDEDAKKFDNFMYGLMLADIDEKKKTFKKAKNHLISVAAQLESKSTVPQIKAEISTIQRVQQDQFWDASNLLEFEKARIALRGLMKFLIHEKLPPIYTIFNDTVVEEKEDIQLEGAYDFEDYKKKVNRYVLEHNDAIVIYKLTHNKKLTAGDYEELERILTQELGSKEDYEREYGDTPFGLMIRKIAKLDHDSAMEAFSHFINDASLNQKQIAFVQKIINHVEKNGYMESKDLMKPPFDKPIGFLKMFDPKKRASLIQTINEVKDNAVSIIA